MENTAATINACKGIFYIGDAEPMHAANSPACPTLSKCFDPTARRARVKDAAKFVHFFIMEPSVLSLVETL
jgi:hypothetical protein